jgi:hypothetical protein
VNGKEKQAGTAGKIRLKDILAFFLSFLLFLPFLPKKGP